MDSAQIIRDTENKRRTIPESCLKAEKILKEFYPDFYQKYSGFRNSGDKSHYTEMELFCNIRGIKWFEIMQTVEFFIN